MILPFCKKCIDISIIFFCSQEKKFNKKSRLKMLRERALKVQLLNFMIIEFFFAVVCDYFLYNYYYQELFV